MKPEYITTVIILMWMAFPFAWNAFTFSVGWVDVTFSEVIILWCRQYPMLGVLLGFITGAILAHWFWPVNSTALK